MTDIETTVENARAQYHYPPIRTAILPSDADELQLRLADRLHRHRHQHALEVIADLGRVFDAEEAEPAIEALGRLLVHASLLAGCERMAIAPIIALGRELTRDSQVSNELPLKAASMLAHAALDHRQEPAAIVRGLAMAIAKAIDDCEIVHELKIYPLELFKIAAREVLDGKPTAVTAPAVQPTQPDKAAQRALAWAELRKASEAVVADEQAEVVTPEQRANIEHWYTTPHETLTGKKEPVEHGFAREYMQRPVPLTDADGEPLKFSGIDRSAAWDPDGGRPINPDVGAAAAMVGVQYEVAEDGMGGEEQIPIPLYDPPDLYDNKASGPVFGLAGFIPQTAHKALETIAPVVEGIMRDEIQRRTGERSPAHEVLVAIGADLDAAALAVGPPGKSFERRIIDDPESPGDGSGTLALPPGKRWETDAEFRERIKALMGAPACWGCGALMSPSPGTPGEWICSNDHRK